MLATIWLLIVKLKVFMVFGSMFLLLNYFSNLKGKMGSDFNEWVKSAKGAPQISSLGLIDTADTLKPIC